MTFAMGGVPHAGPQQGKDFGVGIVGFKTKSAYILGCLGPLCHLTLS